MFFPLSRVLRTAGFAVFACAASVLGAQEGTLDFVVTAGRTAEDPAAVPAQVIVISAGEIAESGASSLVQVLERVPGVSFMPSMAGPGTESVSMRGFGENSFGRVLILIDGVRLNNPDMKSVNWNAVALADIERIEVLDGSASVLYGNNAVAGVINIITKKGGTGTTVSGSVGSYSTNLQKLSHQSSTDWGRLSIAAEHIGSEGYRDRQAAQTVNASVRGTIDLSDTLSLTAQASLADLGYQLPGSLNATQFEADPTQAANWADEGTEHHYAGGLNLEWLPTDKVQVELPLYYNYKMVTADMASYSTPSFADRLVHTGEARPKAIADLSGMGLPVRLVAGVDLYGAYLDVHSYTTLQRTTELNAFIISELSAGPYLSAKAELLPGFNVSGGTRYDAILIKAENSDKSVDGSISHGALVYDAGLTLRPAEGIKAYAKYSTLFRYPFTDEQTAIYGFGTDELYTDLKPETGFNVEMGTSLHFGSRLSVNGNIYYLKMQDEIAYSDATFKNENLDQTRRIGSNIGLNMRPLDFLDIDASYTFVDAVFTAGANNGKYIPLVAKHSTEASVTFMLPAGLKLGPTVSYRSDAFQGGDNANTQVKVDAYLIYGAQARWELEREGRKVSLQLIARNLLDTSYAPLMFYSSFSGTSSYYPAEGRSISVSVEYRY